MQKPAFWWLECFCTCKAKDGSEKCQSTIAEPSFLQPHCSFQSPGHTTDTSVGKTWYLRLHWLHFWNSPGKTYFQVSNVNSKYHFYNCLKMLVWNAHPRGSFFLKNWNDYSLSVQTGQMWKGLQTMLCDWPVPSEVVWTTIITVMAGKLKPALLCKPATVRVISESYTAALRLSLSLSLHSQCFRAMWNHWHKSGSRTWWESFMFSSFSVWAQPQFPRSYATFFSWGSMDYLGSLCWNLGNICAK